MLIYSLFFVVRQQYAAVVKIDRKLSIPEDVAKR